MRILVVSQYYYPESFKINTICEDLVHQGHQVVVLTGLPNYPLGHVLKDYRWHKKRKENINGVQVYRCFEIGRGKSTFKLILNYLSFIISSSFKALWMKESFDVIFVYQLSPITMVLPALILKKRLSIPLMLYSLDIWPESIKNIVPNEKHPLFKIIKKLSFNFYRRCDRIAVTSFPFCDYFHHTHHIPYSQLYYLPQHADKTYLDIPDPIDNGIVDFIFAGNIGTAQAIDCIVNAVALLQTRHDFKVHLVGDGSHLNKIKAMVNQLEINHLIYFYGHQPLEKMTDFYQLADVCLLTLQADSLISETIPAKLQGYMAAGRPIIGAINGVAKTIIHEAKCGICVDANDHFNLAKAMEDFIENPEQFKDCGHFAKSYFLTHFTQDIYMQSLIQHLSELMTVTQND